MSYSLKDVDAAEALIRSEHPDAIIERGDYDWSLSVADKDWQSPGIILFQPRRDDIGQPEIKSSTSFIKDFCFMFGSQWTPEQVTKLNSRARPKGQDIKRIQ